MTTKLFEPIKIGSKIAINRIMMPSVLLYKAGTKDGAIGDFRMAHYEKLAQRGVGMLVVEATAVQEDYRLAESQLGIWSDDFIDGFKKLESIIHKYPVVTVVQLQHCGGRRRYGNEKGTPIGPSTGEYDKCCMREATVAELEGICKSYIDAALRLKEAGFDGVELHSGHGHLLTQMLSPLVNKRNDEYGGTTEKRMKLSIDIVQGIRKACGNNFLIGIRLGVNEPTYDDGIANAKIYEKNGVDYINLCVGHGDLSILPETPDDFPYNVVVYGGRLIKESTDGVPIVLVNDVKTAERGEWLLQNGYGDMVAYGKGLLTTPDFVSRAKTDPSNNSDCTKCESCAWFTDYKKCPALAKHKHL